MSVDLSIIIVTYNGLDITLQTLACYWGAVRADSDHRYEIIVVDNDSQEAVADAVAQRYPEVCLIRNSDNLGYSKANNIGFRSSSGRHILFSNPDIEVFTQTLPTLIALMDQSPEVGACTPFLKLARTGEVDWGAHRGFPTPWAAFTYFTKLSRLFRGSRRLSRVFGRYHLLDRDLAIEHEVDAIKGCFFFVRRKAFEGAGRWDEDYFMFGEDIDLCYQIKQRGYKILFYPQATAVHYHGITTGLKQHTQCLSSVDVEAKERAYQSFYDTMKLFYDKNYRQKYGRLLRWLVFLGIDARSRLGRRGGTV